MRTLRRAAMAGALVGLCLAGAAGARPFTIDDLLHQETFGDQVIDPTGRWIVFEQRVPYDTGRRFDWYLQTPAPLTRLMKVDLRHPAAARPLLAAPLPPGQTLGDFSPSGARLAIFRFRGKRLSLGVVTVATGAARWFDLSPERPDWGRGLQWLSDRELLVIARPPETPTLAFRQGRASADVLPGLWAASATGSGGHTVVGSGAYAHLRPRPAPRQLLRLDVRTGASRRLATGEFTDLELSPDGRRVALLEAGPDVQPLPGGPTQGAMGIADQQQRLSLIDLRTGVQRFPCEPCDVTQHLLSWSPQGDALLVFARKPETVWTAGHLLRIDAGGRGAAVLDGGLRPVLDLRPEVVHAGWMGASPILLAQPAGASPAARADWFRLGDASPVNLTRDLPSAPRRLAAIDARGFTALSAGGAWRVSAAGEAEKLTEAARAVATPRLNGATLRLDVVPPAGSWVVTGADQLQWLDAHRLIPAFQLPAAPPRALLASRENPAALIEESDPHGVSRLQVVGAGARNITVAMINSSLGDVDPPMGRPVRHVGPDGQALTSWLFLPPRRTAAPPPLVVQAYLGGAYATAPTDYPGERGFLTHIQMLTGHGYAVLVASLPLGKAVADPMLGVGPRIEGIVDAAAADPALARTFDDSRVALWGHSYGGYTVMAAIAQTGRFKAAVSIAGLSDLISKWETMPAIYRATPEEGLHNNWSSGAVESGQEGMKVPPWSDPERYIRNSPLFVADKIHTPLLLAHGDQDVIPLPQSEAMFSALYRQDRDAVLVTYFGEGHLITNPGNVRDFYSRAFAFLDEHFAEAQGRDRGAEAESGTRPCQ